MKTEIESPLVWQTLLPPWYQSEQNDFWLYQGNCIEMMQHLPDNSVRAIFADPPYFLSNGGISVQSGKQVCVDKGDWDKGGTPEYIYEFNRQWLSLCRNKLTDDGTIWISGTHHNIHVVMRCLQELGYKVLNNQRAEYGKQIVAEVARQLQTEYGSKALTRATTRTNPPRLGAIKRIAIARR